MSAIFEDHQKGMVRFHAISKPVFFLPSLREGLLFDMLCDQGMHPFQVVGHTDQIPFPGDSLKASEEKVTKPHGLLNDPKDGFYGAFSFGVYLLAFEGLESMLHPGHRVCVLRQRRGLRKTFF